MFHIESILPEGLACWELYKGPRHTLTAEPPKTYLGTTAFPVPAQSAGTEWFSIAGISTAMEKNTSLCDLCASSEASGDILLTDSHRKASVINLSDR